MQVQVLPYYSKQGIDTTSHGPYKQSLSPFYLGPCNLYGSYIAMNVENAWQYSKVYLEHTTSGEPNRTYWEWAVGGWRSNRAERYPMGKGRKPLYTLWNGEKLDYVTARKQVYVPLYARCVIHTPIYKFWKTANEDIVLRDFDAYDHRALGMSWQDVMDNPDKKMGHAFVIAMLLEGFLKEEDYEDTGILY